MKIAILGTRGIPARYGGYETFAEELAKRLVRRGHDVTVYCRPHATPDVGPRYHGVKLVKLPTIRQKYLDTVVHTGLSALHAMWQRFDVVLFCNAANAVFTFLPRLTGSRVLLNVDGIEKKRQKWGPMGRLWYGWGERLATWFPHRIVADAQVIQDYYQERYGAGSELITYGVTADAVPPGETLKKYGLEPDRYFLYVSRLEPENNCHRVLQAYRQVETDCPLVVVGDAPYSQRYIASLHEMADERVIFTGYVFGDGYRELQSNTRLYIHATEVGGTHPALLEGMGYGHAVVANGTPENVEVVGDAGLLYAVNDVDDLAAKLRTLESDPELRAQLGEAGRRRVAETYSWNSICAGYERLFLEQLGREAEVELEPELAEEEHPLVGTSEDRR
ncbi:MAG: glycosyltransferase [Planctomycetota bacterium]